MELAKQTARECGTDKHKMWNKWPEYLQQTDRTCDRNNYCKHVDQMTPAYLLSHEHFYKVQAAKEQDMKTDINSLRMRFFCVVLFRSFIHSFIQ